MPLAVATRTVIHRRWRLRFLWGSLRIALQASNSTGYLGGALRITRGPTFWTLTLWADGSAMHAFRESGPHGGLMPKMAEWGSQVSTAAWRFESRPSWDEAFDQMLLNARWIEVAHPDQRQRDKQLDRPSAWGMTLPVPRRIAPRNALPKGSSE